MNLIISHNEVDRGLINRLGWSAASLQVSVSLSQYVFSLELESSVVGKGLYSGEVDLLLNLIAGQM